jgi:hypothetical protein
MLVLTRRRLVISGGAFFLYAPAVVPAASLMALRGIPLQRQQAPLERPQGLERNVREGKMRTVLNGAIVPVADARRMVAYARANGWLPATG